MSEGNKNFREHFGFFGPHIGTHWTYKTVRVHDKGVPWRGGTLLCRNSEGP